MIYKSVLNLCTLNYSLSIYEIVCFHSLDVIKKYADDQFNY